MKVVTENDSATSYSLAVSRGDTLHVVWERFWDFTPDTIGKDVYWRWAKDTVWGPVVNLSNGHWIGQRGTLDPSIVADTFGAIHLASRYLTNPWSLHYLRREGGVWRDTSFDYDGALPQLTVDGLGQVHLVYTRPYSVFYRKRDTTGVWGSEELVSDSLVWASGPTVVVGRDNRPRVIYYGNKSGLDPGRVYFSERMPAGNWRGPDLISPSSDTERSRLPSVAVDSLNRLWVAWDYTDSSILSRFRQVMGRRHDGVNWDSLTILTDTALHCYNASLSERAWNGGADVVWEWLKMPEDSAVIMYGWWPFSPSGVEQGPVVPSPFYRLPFSVVPNPFVSYAVVLGHAKERFSLYDVSGRKVGVYQGNRVGLGLSAGIYFLKPEGDNAKPLRIVKLR
jgi:hypothetical protein